MTPKNHQLQEHLVPSAVSSKILKQALLQQKEIQREEDNDANIGKKTLATIISCFPKLTASKTTVTTRMTWMILMGFPKPRVSGILRMILMRMKSCWKLFYQKKIALNHIVIVEKIKEEDALVSSAQQVMTLKTDLTLLSNLLHDACLWIVKRPMPKLDNSIIELYKGVGKLLNKYTSCKMPKAFKHIPSLQFWEEVLHLTEPEKWSPNAMYQATRIFASNMGVKKVEHFISLSCCHALEKIFGRIRDCTLLYTSFEKGSLQTGSF